MTEQTTTAPNASAATDVDTTDGTTTDASGAPTTRRSHRPLLISLAILVIVAVIAAVFVVRSLDSGPVEAVAATVPVPITVAHVPNGTKIGVVVTLGDGEGSEWNQAAQGALVAERRLSLGGTRIALETRNDGGTAAGARSAVEALVRSGVAGIVVASSGSHVSAALDAAAKGSVPVVLPYASGTKDSWSTAPSSASVGTAMTTALGGASSPLLVDLGGGTPDGLRVAHVLDAGSAPDLTAVATEVAQRTGVTGAGAAGTDPSGDGDGDGNGNGDGGGKSVPRAPDSDAVVVSGPAAREGALVAALQAADVTVPVVLTPDATSPAFGSALAQAGGSLSGSFRTVGAPTDDARALSSGAAGRAMSAFLAGVRVLGNDGDAKNLTGDQPFSAVAGAADATSHDAVVALVRAVGAARSVEPSAVTDALAKLDLGADDGIAGPELDFSDKQALGGRATVLAASAQSLGLRPAPASTDTAPGAALIWFEEFGDK